MKKARIRKYYPSDSINKILLFSTSLFIFTLFNLSLGIDGCLAGVGYLPGSTQKICQLTGDFDKDINFNQPTINLTDTRYGVVGTDLGSSFKHDGKIYFLFGDTYPSTIIPRPEAADSIAYTEETYPNNCLNLTFNTGIDGKFDPPTVLFPGFDQGGCSVPVEGLSYNGDMYVYFITGDLCDDHLGECYLAKSLNDGHTFLLLYKLSVDYKFLKVQVEVVENSDDIQYNGIRQLLPTNVQNQPVLFIWGSGKHREGNPYLAYMPLEDIENKSEIRYYTGTDASGIPQWSTSGSEAVPLFTHPCVGDPSVSWNPFLKKWLMLYTCSDPRGVNFRVADYPWGTWSETQVLFDANEDNGLCYFMHKYDCPDAGSGCDQNYDCLQEDKNGNRCCRGGGAYGPYVISDFSEGLEGIYTTIYFTLSTWNPYQVMLMKSTLVVDCSITVTSPSSGEDCLMYNTKTIMWTSSGAGNYVKIELGLPTGCGLSWSTITSSTSNDGSYNWSVPGPARNNCKIKICSLDHPDCCGESPSFDMVLPTITVSSPSSGVNWEIGSSKSIRWSSLGVNGNVSIQLGRPSGCGYIWSTITSSTSNDGSYDWEVQGPAQDNCKIRITSIAHTDVYGESGLFDIITVACGCTSGSIRQGFSSDMVMCARVPQMYYYEASQACAEGWHVCSPYEYGDNGGASINPVDWAWLAGTWDYDIATGECGAVCGISLGYPITQSNTYTLMSWPDEKHAKLGCYYPCQYMSLHYKDTLLSHTMCCKYSSAPPTPTNLQVTNTTDNSITWSWNAVSEATSYDYIVYDDSSCYYILHTGSTSNTFHIETGLAPATTYSFKVKACNSLGCSSWSICKGGATSGADPPPDPPTNLRVTTTTSSSITWSWDAVPDASSYDYYVYNDGTCSSPREHYFTSDTFYTATGLSPGTTYSFKVKVCTLTGSCSGWSNCVAGTTN